MDTIKLCNRCKVEKPLSDFNLDRSRKDGLQNRCRDCKRKQDKEYTSAHREENSQRSKRWRGENVDRAKENIKRWHDEHKDRCRELQRESWKRTGKARRLRKNISVAIKRSLKGGWPSEVIFNKLGYTIDQLKEHLEKKFKEGMSWDNHGEWHIDHVIPQSWLPFDSIEDENFLKCWCLDNLQPLWAKENITKQDRYAG